MQPRNKIDPAKIAAAKTGRRRAVAVILSRAAWPVLLLLAALLVPITQLVVGVAMVGANKAHDGAFTVFTLVQYQNALRTGDVLPRWAASGYAGLGSPIFFIYPPGAYALAALLGIVLPSVSAAGVIGMAQILLRIGTMLTCLAWLRRRTTTQAALTGSALYGLMPWVSIFNPQIRLDFAECAAAVLVPLVFLAVDAGRGRLLETVLLVAAAMGGLTLIHLPTTVATGGLALVYATVSGHSWRTAVRRAAATLGGILLGLGLAACYVLPAVSLLRDISTSALWDAAHRPEGHFILGLNTFHRSSLLVNMGLLVPGALVALVCGGAIIARRQASNFVRSPLDRNLNRRWHVWSPPWGQPERHSALPVAATFAFAACMALPISAPLWALLPPLRLVQFPGRFLMPASLLASGVIAIVLPSCRPGLQRVVLAAGFALGAGVIVLVIQLGDGMSASRTRTQEALADPRANAPEYVPAHAGVRGWLGFAQKGGDVRARAARLVSPCVRNQPQEGAAGVRPLTFNTEHCSGATVLPQFYFPGWIAKTGGRVFGAVEDDPASGLVRINVPPRARRVTLDRVWLQVEWLGALISVLSSAVWFAALYAKRRNAKAMSQRAALSAASP